MNNFTGLNCLYKVLDSKIFKNSTILTNEQSLSLCNITNIPSNQTWSLLYQASRDGFKASDFHNKVNGVQNTLIIVKTTSGNIFGGFTEADWGGSSYQTDPNAFIFSLVNSFNISVKMNIKQSYYAAYDSSYYGPTFGGGHDIYISDQSNTNTNSYSNIYSYEMPSFGYATSLLAGSYNFKTFEIEVYSVFIDRKQIFFKNIK